ncbi:hypothetical protein SSX86_012973 [Deinandra increscens subsp. villosa]|uniref:ribose-5-phosphate isomerase n=1 Tax=Deinandra increscens subsp. villosa TaxID=3103831 RepID=A0AAP0D9Q9_9ASTR
MALIHPSTSYLNLRTHTHFTHQKSATLNRSRPNFRPLIARSSLNHTNVLLFDAAKHTVDTYLQSGMVVGLGSGTASSLAIEYLGYKLRVGLLKDIVGIPTSARIASEAEKAGIPLHQYQDSSQIDLTFNDADIMEEGSLHVVIGRRRLQGEESIIEEKKILDVTENLVVMVTEKQYKTAIEGSIPVLVKSVSWMDTAEEIDDLFVGDAEVWRRPSMGHADPTGGNFPLVTSEGHNVLDVIFTSPIPNLAEVATLLNSIDGVACHGIVTKAPCTAVITTESGLRVIDNSNMVSHLLSRSRLRVLSRSPASDFRRRWWQTDELSTTILNVVTVSAFRYIRRNPNLFVNRSFESIVQMFKNTFQSGFLSILYSLGSKPLQIWDKEVVNGQVKRIHDEDIQSNILEIVGTNIPSTYITCPADPAATLGIKLPFLVMIVKNVNKYFTFEIQVLDDKNVRRRFRASNYQAMTRVKPFICTMPLRMDEGWNQIQLNLSDLTRRAYGTNYVETLRVQVHANCRLRRIYFSDRLYSEEELPPEFRLYLPMQVTFTSYTHMTSLIS